MTARHRERVCDHLVADVLRVSAHETAAAALDRLEQEKPASVELALVCGDAGRLEGVVPMQALLHADGRRSMGHLVQAGFPVVAAAADQEEAASLALHHCVDALPVVAPDGRALGVMPTQALLQVLRREHIEDLHRLAGIEREASMARHAIEDPPLRRARHRLPWLLVGLAGSGVATAAMASMERTLEANVAIAFFVPALVYLADAIGTQTEAVAVRGLSLTRAGIGPLLLGELRTGMLIGALLGLIAFAPVWLAFGDARLAMAVSVSILAAGTVANGIGMLFPWMLHRLGFDPAYGTGPGSTVVQDVCTILVYFGVVRLAGA